jgi:glycosidase
MNKIAKGEKKLDEIDAYLHRQDSAYLKSAYRMTFTTNHDENTWNGTGGERYGAARPVYDVLAFTLGMPLVYSGQEGGEHNAQGKEHRLRFFDKDTVQWHGYPNQDMYARLFKAHHENPALWNGEFGGPVKRLKTSSDDVLYCFTRQKDGNEVVVLLNFSDKPQKVDFVDDVTQTELHSIFNNQLFSIYSKGGVPLPAHGYQVFVK